MENNKTENHEEPEWVMAVRYIQEQLPDMGLIPTHPRKMTMEGARWVVNYVKSKLKEEGEGKK